MKNRINEIVNAVVSEMGFYLYDIRVKGSVQKPIIGVYVDTDEGITIGQCEKLSRKLHELLEAEPGMSQDYRLDVSSPGLTSHLKHEWQFRKNLGQEMIITTSDETIGSFEGVLKSIDQDGYLFQTGKREVMVNREKIKKAKLKIKWS